LQSYKIKPVLFGGVYIPPGIKKIADIPGGIYTPPREKDSQYPRRGIHSA
jgi:hypothetical protein